MENGEIWVQCGKNGLVGVGPEPLMSILLIACFQMLKYETALAERRVDGREGGVNALPNCIDQTRPFSYVVDNNDLNEEHWMGRELHTAQMRSLCS